MKILIVDDKKEDLYLLETLLKGKDYEAVSARNGIEALQRLKENCIDMIISDILMPKMDGFQLCRECKRDNKLRKIPFVFYTATYTEKKDKEFALSLGAEKFILKPEESDVFLKILEGVIKEHRKGAFIAPKRPIEGETVYLSAYNERLIRKLERKMLDLEKTNKVLKESEEKLKEYGDHLEKLVEERTAEVKHTLEDLEKEVTERKRAESLIRKQNERLKELDRMKSEFLSTAAYELRTPLTSILGFSEILLNRRLDKERQNRFLKIINEEAVGLAKLINDLLDVSRIESGRGFKIKKAPIELRKMILESVDLFKSHTDKHDFEVNIPGDLARIEADKDKMD